MGASADDRQEDSPKEDLGDTTSVKKEDGGSSSAQPATEAATARFDLNACSSVEELHEMSPERFKNTLLSMGVKCGGTPAERATRLFSLKGLRREAYPKKVRGKNFIL